MTDTPITAYAAARAALDDADRATYAYAAAADDAITAYDDARAAYDAARAAADAAYDALAAARVAAK